MESVVRFLIGGVAVSAFALLGDILRPKSFAGLFGAAPSVALATLGIALIQHGSSYAAAQGRAMVWGAIALFAYSILVCQLLMRRHWNALPATIVAVAACCSSHLACTFWPEQGRDRQDLILNSQERTLV